MDDKIASLFDGAISRGESALLDLVSCLRERGLSQVDVYLHFEAYRSARGAVLSEQDDDVLLEIMDRIVGHCSAASRLFDEYLSNEAIDAGRQLSVRLFE